MGQSVPLPPTPLQPTPHAPPSPMPSPSPRFFFCPPRRLQDPKIRPPAAISARSPPWQPGVPRVPPSYLRGRDAALLGSLCTSRSCGGGI